MIQELHAGDRQIPASGWNEMRAAVQGITPGQQQYQSGKLNPAYITIKNTTGATLPAFSAVKLSGATYSRTGDTFVNQAIANGVELNGVTPAAATDTIAITQAACAAGEFVKAIVSGATACMVYKASNVNYQYAAPVAGQAGYLGGTDDVTGIKILWIASGTGNKEAYVLLDNRGGSEPEYFVINPGNDGTQTAIHTPSIFTKGSLHYISYDSGSGVWTPNAYNEAASASTLLQRPAGARLVVCQVDAPNSSAEYKIPYYTPESNMGVAPDFTSYINFGFVDRCGVKPGEHAFTDKMWDYNYIAPSTIGIGASYTYEPQFIGRMMVDGQTGGGYTPQVTINGEDYPVDYPTGSTGLSRCNYPDIYPYDYVTLLFDCLTLSATALDYATDNAAGDVIASYQAPGRGWDAITTPQALTDVGLTLYQKVKTGAIT